MVGDSAVTRKHNGVKTYSGGCKKVQFSQQARIGFAIWGCANVGATRMDQWLEQFIANDVHAGDGIVEVGERLASKLNADLAKTDKSYSSRGIHISGYLNNVPVLYHLHSGHLDESPHELRLYRDYPDRIPMSIENFGVEIASGSSAQLRNGRFEHFVALFNHVQSYSVTLKQFLNTEFPPPDLAGRLAYYQMLVRFIASVLRISKADGSVNEDLSWVAFDRYGSLIEHYVESGIEPEDANPVSLEC